MTRQILASNVSFRFISFNLEHTRDCTFVLRINEYQAREYNNRPLDLTDYSFLFECFYTSLRRNKLGSRRSKRSV